MVSVVKKLSSHVRMGVVCCGGLSNVSAGVCRGQLARDLPTAVSTSEPNSRPTSHL
jgi:hypothetical protein